MAGSEQDQVMDAKLIAERQVIEKYLAGQLSDAEADAFEARLESHPELARDVEQIARMKTGFAVLERRGELAKLLAHPVAPPKRRAAWMAAAAAVFVGAIGFLVFRQAESPAPATLLAISLDALSRHSDSPIPLRASIALARARGLGADAELESGKAPGAAELELATGDAAQTHYSVELLAIDSSGAKAVAKLPDAATDGSGAMHLFVSLQAVKPGPYLLRLTPAGGGTPVEYSIAVRPAR
jgi:anti-sigma factor RsiW